MCMVSPPSIQHRTAQRCKRLRPYFFVHGHVHLNYGRGVKREDTYNDTRIINAYERYTIEI